MPPAQIDARLDGTLTFVTVEPEPPARSEVAKAEPPAPDPSEKNPAESTVQKESRAPAEHKPEVLALPQKPDPVAASDVPAGAPLAVEPPKAKAASKLGPSLEAVTAGAPVKTALATEAAPVPDDRASSRTPAHVSPGVAASLRVYDTFPRMPEPLRSSANPHLVVMNVCVSVEGRVDGVRFSADADPMLARTLREAVNTWRYRPLMLGEGPTPFCHEMGVSYRVR